MLMPDYVYLKINSKIPKVIKNHKRNPIRQYYLNQQEQTYLHFATTFLQLWSSCVTKMNEYKLEYKVCIETRSPLFKPHLIHTSLKRFLRMRSRALRFATPCVCCVFNTKFISKYMLYLYTIHYKHKLFITTHI